MQLVLHKHLIVREELHYGLDDEAKVVISFLPAKLQYKTKEHFSLYFHPLLEMVKVF